MLNLGAQANQQDNIRKIQAPCHCRSCLKNLLFLWRGHLIWSGLRPGYLQICRRSCKMQTTWFVSQHIFNIHCRASTDSLGCRSCMGRESNRPWVCSVCCIPVCGLAHVDVHERPRKHVFRHQDPKGRCKCTHGCHKSARHCVASITEMERHQTVLV